MNALACLAAIVLSLGLGKLRGAEVHLFAAASLSDALKEIAPQFKRQTGHELVLNLGASSLLARQIEQGAPADIFFSADEAKMDLLVARGLIVVSTRKRLLGNSLVIIVEQQSPWRVSQPEDLLENKIERIALAETRTVPAGIYARRYLERLKLWPGLQNKIIPTENVRGALAAVEAGNADVAIVYKTDLAVSKKCRLAFEIPPEKTPEISYPIALLKESKQPAAAQELLAYLQGKPAQDIFRRSGFLIPAL